MVQLVGSSIGRYHIVERLGEGGMAQVYKAYDTRLERNVAIKVILPSQQQDEMFLKRFEREAKSLAQLSHSNIVKVLDYGDQDGIPYLIMEYVSGGTLKQRLGKPMPYDEAARLLAPVARALKVAHAHGIFHRDVKPANILLNDSGQPMLSDFGIAKVLEGGESATLTGAGVGIGTPEYMSPEQGLGHPIDQRTDVYSLGVVFYELVTGRKPFRADTPMAVIYKQITEPLPPPSEFIPGLPETVEQVIFKAMAKKPEDRYQDMDAMAEALERMAQKTLVEASQVTQVGRVSEATLVTPGPAAAIPGAAHLSASAAAKPAAASKKSMLPLILIGVGGLGLVVVAVIVGVIALKLAGGGSTASVAKTRAAELTNATPGSQAETAVAGANPEQTPGASSTRPAQTAVVAADGSSFSIADIGAGLAALPSYRITFTAQLNGKDAGGSPATRQDDFLHEVINAGQEEHIRSASSGEAVSAASVSTGDVELFVTNGTTYAYQPAGGACSFVGASQGGVVEAMVTAPKDLIGPIEGAVLGEKGDNANGVAANRYTLDQGNLPSASFTTAEGEVWVAQEGGYVVRLVITGVNAGGQVHWEYDVSDVGRIEPISLPQECTAQAVEIDIPLPKNANSVSKTAGMISFQSADGPMVVANFFKLAVPPKGWTLEMAQGSGDPYAMLIFMNPDDNSVLQVMIQSDGKGGSSTTINLQKD